MDKLSASLIAAFTAAVIFASLTPLSPTSGSISTNFVISGMGNITPLPVLGAINKGVFAYGTSFSDAETTFISNHFNIIDVDFGTQGVQSVKAKNANVKVIGYKDLIGMQTSYSDWALVNSHEDWFLHDTSGNRMRNPVWGWYLMDPSNAGWRAHWVSDLNNKIGTLYDGVFIDDAWNTLTGHGMSGFYSSAVSSWHSNVLGMLQYVKANITPGKLVIINTDEWNTYTYVSAVDGEMLEGFTHADWEDANTQGSRDTGLTMAMINNMAVNSAAGKIVWGASGAIVSSDSADMARMVKYCYASFLLAANGPGAYFEFNSWYSSDGSKGYYSIMDTQIGSPKAAYYQSQNVYMRDYTGGKALFNPTANTYTINLQQNYKLLSGTTVSRVTLNAFSGEVLLSTP